jgi:hypothetical protein
MKNEVVGPKIWFSWLLTTGKKIGVSVSTDCKIDCSEG